MNLSDKHFISNTIFGGKMANNKKKSTNVHTILII